MSRYTEALKMITNYFAKLSREEREQISLRNHQEGRIRNEARAALQIENDIERNRITSQVIERIDSDDSRDFGDQVRDTFQAIMTNEITVEANTNKKFNKPKRNYGRRPDNWKEITLDFMTYKNQTKTMAKYGLSIQSTDEAAKEKNYNYWKTTLSKWKKQVHSDHTFEKKGQLPVYGKAIDNELADVVRKYYQHGVPMSDFILRCCLIDILTKKLPDIIPKIIPLSESAGSGQYKFGKAWAHRFWKRHIFSNRTATSKMRDDIPAKVKK